ncbi:composite domain of metallo-dependent hydrolase [Obba rivulosa]|uniref:Composite domain of metallo-dependent hydrolase n=1 Tax=Obba rivulosa TaxID=1052685 RepID=A0A8E2AV39_9APHY|nr:composite domain of metallo-dependent hydrolase [Obba rivulosa]
MEKIIAPDLDDTSRRYRPGTGHGSRISRLIVFFGLCALTLTFVLASTVVNLHSSSPAVPLHVHEILDKCARLPLKPGPPDDFGNRSYSDRYVPGTKAILITNGTIWTGRNQGLEIIKGDILLHGGIIKAVGYVSQSLLDSTTEHVTIDAHGAWITPGIIDVHSHIGVGTAPAFDGVEDGNSFKGPIQPWLRSLDGLNTHDDSYKISAAGGVTTSLILPGSANAIGGQAFVIKLRPTKERSPTSLLLEPPFDLNGTNVNPHQPPRWRHMKHACGENPARVYGDTRMDDVWVWRQAYNKARELKNAQDAFCQKAVAREWENLEGQTFPEELQWEALVDILRGKVKVQTHCYEAVDFDNFVRLSQEFEFPVAAFHHAHEAYLVPDVLKKAYEHPPAIAMFSTFARYKREAFRHSEFAPRILADNGIDVVMKSDHAAIVSRYLVNEAALAHYYGLPENIALASVISTPAKVLGLEHRIGYIKEGYDADVVVWDSHPLSLGSTPAQVIIDGIAQIPSAYVSAKPASHSRAPNTPNFNREATSAVKFEGLPPLGPSESLEDLVVFVSVEHLWVRDAAGNGIVEAFGSRRSGSGNTVVVQHGRVLCSDVASDSCLSYLALPDIRVIDLHGGSLQPGLVSFGSNLGLQEIAMEDSTVDGEAPDYFAVSTPPFVEAGYLPRAMDGLQYATRDALLAYRSGVTVGITAPSHSGFLGGLTTAFSLGSAHKLERGALVQNITAVHVSFGRSVIPSISTQVAALRSLLQGHTEGDHAKWFRLVSQGKLPLVIRVDSADIIATLIELKKEVETASQAPLKMTLEGATEAHILARELSEANIGVILKPPRSFPYTWDQRRIVPGPPLSEDSPIAHLVKHNVTVGIGPQGTNAMADLSAWAVRNTRFDAGWEHYESPNVISKETALALASVNVERLLGLETMPGEGDLVATTGGDLLDFEGKVVAVLSPRRGVVDLF